MSNEELYTLIREYLLGNDSSVINTDINALYAVVSDIDMSWKDASLICLNCPNSFLEQIEEKEELVDDTELVAVIAAAIAAYEGTSTDGFVVRSIRRR